MIGLGLALAALVPAAPVYAGAVDLRVTALWGPSNGAAGWGAYGVTVRNRGPDLSGEVRLVPSSGNTSFGSGTWTLYREPIQIAHGATKSFTMYALTGPVGYTAEVTDGQEGVAASQRVSSGGGFGRGVLGKGGSTFSIGLLSGSGNAASALHGLDIAHSSVTPITFGGSLPFPDSALHLQGLDAIVIDGYDTASLLPAQLTALREYVAFGGSLIVTGGSGWRRTLLPLPPELTPLRPASTGRASLDPLAEMVDRHSGQRVAVAQGGAITGRVVVAGAGGPPLVVEGGYGQGRIVELTFDPAAEDVANSDMASLVWSEAVTRAVSFTSLNGKFAPAGTGITFGPGGGAGYSTTGGPGVPLVLGSRLAPNTFEYQVLQVLRSSPAGQLPPLALLAALVGLYVLLAGPVNYALLRRLRRRELFWATGPAVALAATLGLYAVGSGLHGGGFHDEEVQLIRTAPDGSAMVLSYHGLFAPHGGDVLLQARPGSLATATVAAQNFFGGGGFNATPDEVVLGSRPQVALRNVAIWSMRSVETASMARPGVHIRARLSIRSGRVVGEIINDGSVAIRDVRIFSSQDRALLGSDLAPGARLAVDSGLDGYQSALMSGPPYSGPSSSPPDVAKKREIAAEAAATQALGTSDQLIVTGLVDPIPDLSIPGSSVTTSALAAVAFPVSPVAVDRLQGGSPSRLVATASAGSELADVYEMQVPAGVSASLSVRYGPPAGPPVDSLEVFDWSTGVWRHVTPAAQGGVVALRTSEVGGGLVRVRVHEQSPFGSVQVVAGA
ncbi:MAG: hypothetical protein ACREPA_10495 [Candidatus Dormibacteraceae bacterium]